MESNPPVGGLLFFVTNIYEIHEIWCSVSLDGKSELFQGEITNHGGDATLKGRPIDELR